jgi:hypothetical protein
MLASYVHDLDPIVAVARTARAMRRAIVAAATMLLLAGPARAQSVLYGFTGLGASVGGGATRVDGTFSTPIGPLIQPAKSSGALSAGAQVMWGPGRWVVVLPDVQAHAGSGGDQSVPGTVTLGPVSVPFESTGRSAYAWAVLAGLQAGLVSSNRAWVRASIGTGGLSSRIESDSGVGIDLAENLGLAWSTAAGISMWQRRMASGVGFISVDVEADYLRIKGDAVRLSMPSLRVGFRLQRDRR